MKKVRLFYLFLMLCFSINLYATPYYFGIKKPSNDWKDGRAEYKQYLGKRVVFYEPHSPFEEYFNLRKINFGQVYKITEIDDDYIVVLEEGDNPKIKPIKIKCQALERKYGEPDLYEMPCYFIDAFNTFKENAIGRNVKMGNVDYKVIDVVWENPASKYEDYYPCLVLSNGNKLRVDKAVDGRYYSLLSEVEKPADDSIRYGETKTITEEGITKFSYSDNVIEILIYGGYKEFDFIIKNVSDKSIKVVWNEAVFVGMDGTTSKIMHNGIKYSEREGDQPASVIIRGAKLEDMVVPTANVYYESGYFSGWKTRSMFPIERGQTGKISLMLPIQIKETINEYLFIFDVIYKDDYPELSDLISYLI